MADLLLNKSQETRRPSLGPFRVTAANGFILQTEASDAPRCCETALGYRRRG
jgi:hypothetical protein